MWETSVSCSRFSGRAWGRIRDLSRGQTAGSPAGPGSPRGATARRFPTEDRPGLRAPLRSRRRAATAAPPPLLPPPLPPHSSGRSAVSFLAFLPPQRSPSAPGAAAGGGGAAGAAERTFLRRKRRPAERRGPRTARGG